MIGRYEAYLNGVALSSIDNAIIITNVQHQPQTINRKVSKSLNLSGARVLSKGEIDSLSVTIKFAIREYDILKRQEICQKVVRWAIDGGYLTTSDRRWQRLKCVCEQLPAIESVLGWTDEMQMTFVAYSPPFWQEINPTVIKFTNKKSGGSTVYVPGNVSETFVTADFEVKSSKLTQLSVTVADCDIGIIFPTTPSDLRPVSGDHITLDYNDNMIFRMRHNNASILHLRTVASSDNLICKSGDYNNFSFATRSDLSEKVTATFTVRGWWY